MIQRQQLQDFRRQYANLYEIIGSNIITQVVPNIFYFSSLDVGCITAIPTIIENNGILDLSLKLPKIQAQITIRFTVTVSKSLNNINSIIEQYEIKDIYQYHIQEQLVNIKPVDNDLYMEYIDKIENNIHFFLKYLNK